MANAPDHTWLCEKIVEESPLAILYADREGKYPPLERGSRGDVRVSGRGGARAVPRPDRPRAPETAALGRVGEGHGDRGVTRYGRDVLAVPALKKDGTRISIEFYILLLRSPAGEILGSAALIQDVSARWQREKEMKARLQASRRRRRRAEWTLRVSTT